MKKRVMRRSCLHEAEYYERKHGADRRRENVQLIDWNSKDKAKEWRAALADTINAANVRLGIGTHWEHRSNKELGLDTIPEIHLGQCASAMERKGIRTERGNINRQIRTINSKIISAREGYLAAKQAFEEILAKPVEAVRKARTEITEMLDKVSARWARLELPVSTSKYLKYITGRDKMQSIENAMKWLEVNHISTYAELNSFIQKCERSYGQTSFLMSDNAGALNRLKELVKLYDEYKPYKKYHDESEALKGRAKRKYDTAHAKELERYSLKRSALINHLDGEKIAPTKWQTEIAEIEKALAQIKAAWSSDIINLSMGDVIEHNREKVARAEQMERETKERNERDELEQARKKQKKQEQSL